MIPRGTAHREGGRRTGSPQRPRTGTCTAARAARSHKLHCAALDDCAIRGVRSYTLWSEVYRPPLATPHPGHAARRRPRRTNLTSSPSRRTRRAARCLSIIIRAMQFHDHNSTHRWAQELRPKPTRLHSAGNRYTSQSACRCAAVPVRVAPGPARTWSVRTGRTWHTHTAARASCAHDPRQQRPEHGLRHMAHTGTYLSPYESPRGQRRVCVATAWVCVAHV